MRIGLNATCLNDRPSGARQRFIGIYGALIRQNPADEFVVYEPSDCRVAGWFSGLPNVIARPTPIPSAGRIKKLIRSRGFWRGAFARDRLDLFEVFNLPLVKAPGCPTILTIHDIRYIHPDVPWPQRFMNAVVLQRALAGADHVITVSDAIRDEVLAVRPGTPATTVYNGIDAGAFAGSPPHRAAGEGSEPYLLAVGHLEPRKNYATLIRAMEELRARGDPTKLLIVGNDGGSRTEIASSIEAAGLGRSVRLMQNVPDDVLRGLYAGCAAVVFPSTYEGFGIPVLEAMASGKPLILSDIPVFRELTEGRASYFSPKDHEALARLIQEVAASADARDRQIRYGAGRIRDFSFPVLAAQVARLHRALVPGR